MQNQIEGGVALNQIEVGKFIAKCRKDKKLTQAQLAEKLNITDRAVSKWETGKSMPDSSIMLELCEMLDITANELLSGRKVNMENYEQTVNENLIALKKKDENNVKRNVLFFTALSITFLIGMGVCAICDFAAMGSLTWSLIPISSIIFTWITAFPVIMFGKKGIAGGLLSISVLIIPYLYVLSNIVNSKPVFSIGWIMAIISIIYLWIIFVVFKQLNTRKWLAYGITVTLSIPIMIIINFALSRMLSEPVLDIWDGFSVFLILIVSIICFSCDYIKNKKAD